MSAKFGPNSAKLRPDLPDSDRIRSALTRCRSNFGGFDRFMRLNKSVCRSCLRVPPPPPQHARPATPPPRPRGRHEGQHGGGSSHELRFWSEFVQHAKDHQALRIGRAFHSSGERPVPGFGKLPEHPERKAGVLVEWCLQARRWTKSGPASMARRDGTRHGIPKPPQHRTSVLSRFSF